MEDVIIDQDQKKKEKVYSMRSIWVGTFVGGPLAAGYLVSENFKAIGATRQAMSTWLIAVVATAAIFGGILMVPDAEKLPRHLVPIIYTAIVYSLVNHFQGRAIKEYIEQTGHVFSVWRSVGIGLIGAVITLAAVFLYVFTTDPIVSAGSKAYGELNHEIYYDINTVSNADVDKVANALTQAAFFDMEQQKSVFLERKEKKYIISVPLIEGAWNESDVVHYYEQLRDETQRHFVDSDVIVNLCDDEDVTIVHKSLN